MTTRIALFAALAGTALTTVAFAQNAPKPAPMPAPAPRAQPIAPGTPITTLQPDGAQPEKPKTTIFAPPPATTPHFEPLWQKGADGKVLPLSGVLDARAMQNNTLIDSATREKIRAAAEDWQADVNQLAIDNLDFLEKIDGEGLIDKLDFNNTDQVRYMSQIMVPFMSTGALSSRLQNKNLITTEQANLNQIIVNDYLQKIFEEIMGSAGVDPIRAEEAPEEQQKKVAKVNNLTHFLYYTACRDVRESYHQLMIDSASMVDGIVGSMELSGDAAGKAKADASTVHAAKTDDQKMHAVQGLLKDMNFDQRRKYLQKAMDMGANKNPMDAVASPGPRAAATSIPQAVGC